MFDLVEAHRKVAEISVLCARYGIDFERVKERSRTTALNLSEAFWAVCYEQHPQRLWLDLRGPDSANYETARKILLTPGALERGDPQ